MALMKATKRDDVGTRKVQALRSEGLTPGVIYGHGQPTQPVTLNKHEVELAILHGERLLEIELEGQKQNVLIKEVQYDTFGQRVLHVDLARVDLDERVKVTVQIVLKGTPIGVSEQDGVLQQTASEVDVECAVRAIPEEITILVTGMNVGDRLTMGDVPLPEGATLLDDPDKAVANVTVLAEEEEAPAEAEAAEPEVIGEKEQPESQETEEAPE